MFKCKEETLFSKRMTKTEKFWRRLPFTTFFDSKFIDNSLDKKLIENVKKNDLEGVEKSLLNGAKIDARDENKKNALMIALENENYKMAELFIREGINLFVRDKQKKMALHYAAKVGKDLKFVSLILNEIPYKKQIKIINLQDRSGNTPLHYAVMNSNYYVVSNLLQKKANYRIVNNKGESSYTLAEKIGNQNILNELNRYK